MEALRYYQLAANIELECEGEGVSYLGFKLVIASVYLCMNKTDYTINLLYPIIDGFRALDSTGSNV